jgi:hypothetical protein
MVQQFKYNNNFTVLTYTRIHLKNPIKSLIASQACCITPTIASITRVVTP